MMNVQSQAGPGSYGGAQGPGGARGNREVAHGPGYGAALLAFGLLVVIAAGSVRYMREHDMPAVFENSSESGSSTVEAVAVMGQKRFTSKAGEFRNADAVAVMGHCILDLRQAVPVEGRVEIDAVAVMGQLDILVPADWEVVPDDVITIGSLVNRARHTDAANPRTVKLTGAVMLGEMQIRR